MKKLVYVETLYSLLIVLLINKKEDIILVQEEGNKSYFFKLIENLNIKKIKIPQLKKKCFFLKLLDEEKRNRLILNKIKSIKMDEILLQDHLIYSQLLLNNFEVSFKLIEDGTLNYIERILEEEYNKKVIFKSKIMKFLIKNYEKYIKKINCYYGIYGTSSKIDKIYLTGILPIPEIIKAKVEIVNIEKLWEELDKKKKTEILNIFNINLEELELLRKEKEKILLITQPLSEDGIVKEEEKIELYKEILLERRIKKVFIKPHPREKTNYIEVFRNIGIEIKVLPNEFPAEIFMLLDMSFKKVITIFSTAVLNFKHKYEIEFIGTKKYSKLYKRFGDISLEE